MTRKERFIGYVEESAELLKEDGRKLSDCIIELRIKMPTGEIETIINPNVPNKVEYIKKAYDDNLRLKSCNDIFIAEYSIH